MVTLSADTPGFWQRYAAANAEYERITEIASRHQSDHIKRSLGETTPLTEELIVRLLFKYREDELFFDDEFRWLNRPIADNYRYLQNARVDAEEALELCRMLQAAADTEGMKKNLGLLLPNSPAGTIMS